LQRVISTYALALAAVVLAVLLRWLLDPLIGDDLPLVTLFGAVAAAVWVGGFGPAIVATTLGYFASSYLFMEPRGELGFEDFRDVVGLIAYLFTCTLIIAIGEAMRLARKRASERGEVLRVTLASIGDAVITTDTHGRVTYVNAVGELLTGWTQREAAGRPLDEVFSIVNEENGHPVENPAIRALRDGTVVGLANHTVLIGRDGVRRSIDDSAAPIKDEDGHVSGCVLIFRDISEKRRMEQLEASRALAARTLASIVTSSHDAIISKSLDGTIRSWNAAASRMFGYEAEEAIGRHISVIIPPERMAEEDRIIASLRAGERIEHFETERRRRDGRTFHVSLTISPIRDDAGNVIGASKIARDITERRRLEDNLRKLAAELSEADRRKNEFLATLSHELRNPLAPLSHMLEVLKRSDGDAGTLRHALEVMERQLGQLVRLVDDLLDLSRVTHNRLELRRQSVELAPVIRQAVHASRPLVEAAAHELQLVLPPAPVYLHADPVRLSQVFGNLLNNACKYTSRGGTITLTAELDASDVVVTVEDTGMGIPGDKLESIFDMFTQVDGSMQGSQGGLGIGLTLVKRLVQMHGGCVEAQSDGTGRGSRFIVRLPVIGEQAEAAAAAPASARAREPGRPRRILVVDDNRDAAASLVLVLRTTGHETLTVHDGASALEAAEKYRPEVVLLDIGLPTLNGYEVCRRVRKQPWGKDVVIIALTGWGQHGDRLKSREAGFDGHVVKPVSFDVLMELLDSLPSRNAAAD
jgi:PAS domain S-box-containing protein